MPLFRRRRKENSDSQHGKEGVNEEAWTRTTEVLAGDRIRWTLIWPTSGLEGKRLTAEGCMASVLSMYVLVLKGPQRRSILKYGPYKDHVRFVSQFPTADVRLFLKNLNTYQFLTWYCVSTKCVTHWDNRNGRLGIKHQITYLLNCPGHIFNRYCVLTKCVTPWDNRNGWLGVKHQITYLLDCPELYSCTTINQCWQIIKEMIHDSMNKNIPTVKCNQNNIKTSLDDWES